VGGEKRLIGKLKKKKEKIELLKNIVNYRSLTLMVLFCVNLLSSIQKGIINKCRNRYGSANIIFVIFLVSLYFYLDDRSS